MHRTYPGEQMNWVPPAALASFKRWLDSGENGAAEPGWHADLGEELGRVEVIFARFVNNAKLAMRFSISIWKSLIDLPTLEGHFIALIPKAQDQISFGHINQDSV